jgi:hypothetical protein
MGMDNMALDFRQALQEEDEHLANMRQWLKKLTLEDSVAT